MIAAGIALVAIPLIGLVVMTVRDMGWKEAAAAWGVALLGTTLISAGALLIAQGLTS